MIDQEPSGDNPLSASTEDFLVAMSRRLEMPLYQRLFDQYLPRRYRVPLSILLVLIAGGGVISVASGDWQFQPPEAPAVSTPTSNPAKLIATYTSLESNQSPTPTIYLDLIKRSQSK